MGVIVLYSINCSSLQNRIGLIYPRPAIVTLHIPTWLIDGISLSFKAYSASLSCHDWGKAWKEDIGSILNYHWLLGAEKVSEVVSKSRFALRVKFDFQIGSATNGGIGMPRSMVVFLLLKTTVQ